MGAFPDPETFMKQAYGQSRPALLVWVAVIAAASADDQVELLHLIVSGKPLPRHVPPPPGLEVWLEMYRKHRSIVDAFGGLLGNFGQGLPTLSQLADEMRGPFTAEDLKASVELYNSMSEEVRRDAIAPWMASAWPPTLAQVREIMDEFDAATEVKAGFGVQMQSAEAQFILRVWLPCYMLYQTYPSELMHLARLGDISALDKLIRLDKSVLGEPRIARYWHEAVHDRGTRFNQLKAAMNGRPQVKLTKAKMRSSLAGLMSQLAARFHLPVTSPEIRELFDLVAKVRGGFIDTHIPESPETFAKAVQRNRTWPPQDEPDKKKV